MHFTQVPPIRGGTRFYRWLRQGSAPLVGIFVFVVFHFDPAAGREIKVAAETGLPARSVPVSIEHIANANDLFGVRPSAGSYNGGRTDGGERQLDAMHPAWEVNRGRNFFVLKLNFARKHSLGEAENMTSNARHLSVGISGVNISEAYRDRLVIGHAPGESQAVHGNSWPMGRDEFLTGEVNGFSREASLPSRHSRQDNREGGNEYGSDGCNRAVVLFRKINDGDKESSYFIQSLRPWVGFGVVIGFVAALTSLVICWKRWG
jgi:hypothetical protein